MPYIYYGRHLAIVKPINECESARRLRRDLNHLSKQGVTAAKGNYLRNRCGAGAARFGYNRTRISDAPASRCLPRTVSWDCVCTRQPRPNRNGACRHGDCRPALEQALGPVRVERSAAEGVLWAARHAARAVLLKVSDFGGRERDLVSALKRAQPAVPVYLMVSAQDEPLARDLVADGAAGYAVLPGDLPHLREVLFPARPAGPAVETEAYLASRTG